MIPRLGVFLSCLCALSAAPAEEKGEPKPLTLHDHHPFRSLGEGETWPERRAEIRRHVQLAAGLLPLPEKTPLNARRFGAVEGDGFRVERVYLESFPGHFVTGSLFTPAGDSRVHGLVDGKRPGVLCPHGHWREGRFYDLMERSGMRKVREEIAIGGERFVSAARNPVIARCVQLARMGCVVFVYDMLGYADSIQFAEHRRGPREAMNGKAPGEWGFVSPQATLHLQTNFGLQTWNSVRALDFLEGLEMVDPDRILVTGASGGATQTMMVTAIDERVDAAFPAVMVSTAMQGGCTCENSHYLRIGQGNIDIAAATAPRPLGLTAADDWTVELEEKGHPDLETLYERIGAPGHYEAHFNTHFQHNYNHVSRTQMYAFLNRHFELGLEEPILEEDYPYLGPDELSVWADPSEKPDDLVVGAAHEREVNRLWAEDAASRWAGALAEAEKGDFSELEEWIAPAWETILRGGIARSVEGVFEEESSEKIDGGVRREGWMRRKGGEERLRATLLRPAEPNGEAVIRLGAGEAERADTAFEGATILLPTLHGQPDSETANPALTQSGKGDPPADSWRRSPVYYYGYNDSAFVRRVREVAAAAAMLRAHPDWGVERVTVEARGGLAAVALAARGLVGDTIDDLRIDLDGFSFADVDDLHGEYMVPGALRYGGVAGLALLEARHGSALQGGDRIDGLPRAVYEALAERATAGE